MSWCFPNHVRLIRCSHLDFDSKLNDLTTRVFSLFIVKPEQCSPYRPPHRGIFFANNPRPAPSSLRISAALAVETTIAPPRRAVTSACAGPRRRADADRPSPGFCPNSRRRRRRLRGGRLLLPPPRPPPRRPRSSSSIFGRRIPTPSRTRWWHPRHLSAHPVRNRWLA